MSRLATVSGGRRIRCSLLVTLAFAAGSVGPQGEASDGMPSQSALMDAATPVPLRDAWLRFHESELCLDLDAVFRFHPMGMEVWILVEEEKAHQRLLELVAPLQPRYRIELYATRPPVEKKSLSDRDPPPSLWNNVELRNYLQDPFSRQTARATGGGRGADDNAHFFLKQRMQMFADQVLEWDKRMSRYARDLPALAEAGYSPGAPKDTRERARVIAAAHAESLDKNVSRLIDNLTQALPRASRDSKTSSAGSMKPPAGLQESADRIADLGQHLSRRVYRFIHPQLHTVALLDLREPSLLESLRALRGHVSRFLEAGRKAAKG